MKFDFGLTQINVNKASCTVYTSSVKLDIKLDLIITMCLLGFFFYIIDTLLFRFKHIVNLSQILVKQIYTLYLIITCGRQTEYYSSQGIIQQYIN